MHKHDKRSKAQKEKNQLPHIFLYIMLYSNHFHLAHIVVYKHFSLKTTLHIAFHSSYEVQIILFTMTACRYLKPTGYELLYTCVILHYQLHLLRSYLMRTYLHLPTIDDIVVNFMEATCLMKT